MVICSVVMLNYQRVVMFTENLSWRETMSTKHYEHRAWHPTHEHMCPLEEGHVLEKNEKNAGLLAEGLYD